MTKGSLTKGPSSVEWQQNQSAIFLPEPKSYPCSPPFLTPTPPVNGPCV